MPFTSGQPQNAGKLADPVFRQNRARKAARAAREARRQDMLLNAKRFKDKAEALAYGYRLGYCAAYRLWKQRSKG